MRTCAEGDVDERSSRRRVHPAAQSCDIDCHVSGIAHRVWIELMAMPTSLRK